MKWRTDKPTADVIVAYLKGDNYTYPFVLHKVNDAYYSGSVKFYDVEIKKWADLEEEKIDKKIPLTNIDRKEQISQVADILFYNTETGQLSIEKCYELAEKIVTKRGVNLREDETVTDIDLIQKSWYRQGYIDGINKQEPQWILEDLKYKANPKYGQPLETVTDCYQLEEAAEGMVDKLTIFGIEDRCEITVVMPKAMLNRLGMIGYGYGLYLTKSGKNR